MFNFIEVCSGSGGMSTGLMKAGFVPLLLNDINRDCCKTLELNHKNIKIVCCSLDELKLEDYIDRVDLIVGGIPCQSFSQAGLRKGLEDPRGELIYKFIDIIHLVKPKVFMIENVKGLMTHDSGKTLQHILDTINKGKMYTIQYRLLNSVNYEVPQKRERIFIVGTLNIFKHTFSFPEERKKKLVLRDVLSDVPKSDGLSYTKDKVRLFKLIPQGGCWIDLPEDEQKNYMGKSFYSSGGRRGILHRLSMDKPSLTLLCSPSQKQTERCHPLEERPLTIREYARIQTFDDEYIFYGSVHSQYKQIGNAVPVELARYLGLEIKKFLLNDNRS